MAHGRPWYKRSGGDFVMGTMSMPDAEHKWAYSAIIDMLNDRDRPIRDDKSFIIGFTGLSKNKWTRVRRYLIENGYLIECTNEKGEAHLTNPRFERERQARIADHERAVKNGRAGGLISAEMRRRQGEFDLDPKSEQTGNNPKKTQKNGPKLGKSSGQTSEKVSGKTNPTSKENKDMAQAPPQATRAREEARGRESTHSTESPNHSASENRSDDWFDDMTIRCVRAAGLAARASSNDKLMAASNRIVREWVKAGIDIEATVIPVIEDAMADSDEPTSSLKRFSKAIDQEHRKRVRKAPAPDADIDRPPARYDFEDEDDRIADGRKRLAKRIGEYRYRWYFNDRIRFAIIDDHYLDMIPAGESRESEMAHSTAVHAINHGDRSNIQECLAGPIGLRFRL